MAEMSATELTAPLADYFEGIGGLATDTEKAIARELVRRVQRLELLGRGMAALPDQSSAGGGEWERRRGA